MRGISYTLTSHVTSPRQTAMTWTEVLLDGGPSTGETPVKDCYR